MVSDDIEREKLSFEVKKWAESSAIEKQKMWASMISIVVPLLVVAATIYATTHAQQRESQAAFELKVVEVILQSKSPTEAKNRVDAVMALFPEKLPGEFSTRLEPFTKHEGMDDRGLLNLLVTSPRERRKEILSLWLEFYPQDRKYLPEGLAALIDHQQAQ